MSDSHPSSSEWCEGQSPGKSARKSKPARSGVYRADMRGEVGGGRGKVDADLTGARDAGGRAAAQGARKAARVEGAFGSAHCRIELRKETVRT